MPRLRIHLPGGPLRLLPLENDQSWPAVCAAICVKLELPAGSPLAVSLGGALVDSASVLLEGDILLVQPAGGGGPPPPAKAESSLAPPLSLPLAAGESDAAAASASADQLAAEVQAVTETRLRQLQRKARSLHRRRDAQVWVGDQHRVVGAQRAARREQGWHARQKAVDDDTTAEAAGPGGGEARPAHLGVRR